MENHLLLDLQIFYTSRQIKKIIPLITPSVMIISTKNVLDLFKIDWNDHGTARSALFYHYHMQPSEIDKMLYMDFEDTLIRLADLLKEKKKAEEEGAESHKANMPNYSKQLKSAGNFKPPKMTMPKM